MKLFYKSLCSLFLGGGVITGADLAGAAAPCHGHKFITGRNRTFPRVRYKLDSVTKIDRKSGHMLARERKTDKTEKFVQSNLTNHK